MKNHWRKLYSLLGEKMERQAFDSYFKKEHEALQKHNPLGIASNITKQQALKDIRQQYNVNTLVETGTYLGDTLFALYPFFDQLYSIELSNLYFEKAKRRFNKYKKITLINGDSGKELKNLVPKISAPALFWLDGHYSGGLTAKGDKECPVFEELDSIFASPHQHLVVIDDARLFVGTNDYPTLDQVKSFMESRRPTYNFSVVNDSIRLLPAT